MDINTLNNNILPVSTRKLIDPNYIVALTKDIGNTRVNTWPSNTISYSFMATLPSVYESSDHPGFTKTSLEHPLAINFAPLDAQQQTAAKNALETWAEVANINFQLLGNGVQLPTESIVSGNLLAQIKAKYLGTGGTGEAGYQTFKAKLDKSIDNLHLVNGANIRFGSYDIATDLGGYSSLPDHDIQTKNERYYKQRISYDINELLRADNLGLQSAEEDINLSNSRVFSSGDIFIHNRNSPPSPPSSPWGNPGSYDFDTFTHEIGHALGLSHPGDYDAFGGSPNLPYLSIEKDSKQYAVMSYNLHPGMSSSVYPQTPMLYDIAAIQSLYGANMNTRIGDNTYQYYPNQAFLRTIWDAGGTDTIDASNQLAWYTPTDPSHPAFLYGVQIDLNPGSFSSIGPISSAGGKLHATNNLAIAFDVTIEKAIGSQFNDYLIGNSADNTLAGRAGNDILVGRAGNDIFRGGAGDDSIYGGVGDDDIYGGTGNDTLVGGAGGDTFFVSGSGQGYDTYRGGTGYDTIKATSNNTSIGMKGNFGLDNSIEEISANTNTNIKVRGEGSIDNNWDFSNTKISGMVVNAGIGNDIITVSEIPSLPNEIVAEYRGGAGNDTLRYNSSLYTISGNQGLSIINNGAVAFTFRGFENIVPNLTPAVV